MGSRIGAKFYSVFSSVKSGNAENTADLFRLIFNHIGAEGSKKTELIALVKTKLNLEQVWLAVLPNRAALVSSKGLPADFPKANVQSSRRQCVKKTADSEELRSINFYFDSRANTAPRQQEQMTIMLPSSHIHLRHDIEWFCISSESHGQFWTSKQHTHLCFL